MTSINDDNFKEEISKIEELVLVDFYADWCPPCNKLAPILEKVTNEMNNDVFLVKINVDKFPKVSRDYGVSKIPFVVLFDKGEIIDSFLGFKDEEDVKKWIMKNKKDNLTEEKNNETKLGKSVDDGDDNMGVDDELFMKYEDYANDNDFILNPNKKIVAGILKGLSRNEEIHGYKYCPCRRVTGNRQEDRSIICPCIYHKEEIEIDGKCMCGLFLRSD